jgi:X-Pro dipeptidyl-peptidase
MSARTIVPVLLAVGCASFDQGSAGRQYVVIENGESQPVYSYAEAIREVVYVESKIDSDHDGQLDRIALDIIRPKETNEGMMASTIMEASPYYSDSLAALPPGRQVPAGVPRGFWNWYDEFFVPRGYAVIEVEMQGTARSTGCPTTGGREDTQSIEAAIDWLNGRATGYTAVTGGQQVAATWSTGAVGMIGVSYNGTLPNALATRGIEGLKTIVPIAAISSWYEYTRDRGIGYSGWDDRYPQWLADYVVSQRQRTTCADELAALGDNAGDGAFDHSEFWDKRNYRLTSSWIKASVFVVHGQEDWNVKPHNYGKLWKMLERHDVPRKILLHSDGHIDPVSLRSQWWKSMMHHWFDHWLYNVDNGVMDEPMGTIERDDGSWQSVERWPDASTRDIALHFATAGDGMSGRLLREQETTTEAMTFRDRPEDGQFTKVANPEQVVAGRLAYVSPALANPVRIAGTPRVKVTASLDTTSAPLTAILVDYGPSTFKVPRNRTFEQLFHESCTLADLDNRTGCARLEPEQLVTVSARVITKGTIDAKNRRYIRRAEPVVPGQPFEIEWQLHPKDHVFPAGHRIGVVITGNLGEYATVDPMARNVSLTLAGSQLILPVASGLQGAAAPPANDDEE